MAKKPKRAKKVHHHVIHVFTRKHIEHLPVRESVELPKVPVEAVLAATHDEPEAVAVVVPKST